MKIQSVLRLALFSSLTSASYAAVLPFPVVGPVTPGDALDGSWSQSDGQLASNKLGFYATVGGYQGVGVGALIDDYADIDSVTPSVGDNNFSITANTATVGVSGATISQWFFAITPLTLGTPDNYSINLFDSSAGSLISIDLTNVNATQWSVAVNGTGIGFVESTGLYQLTAAFGGATGVTGAISSFDNASSLPFADSLLTTTGKNFGSLEIGTSKGAGSTFGDGYITVVPEPATSMLAALLPAFFVLRRRR